jgi:hypothetical protein
VQLRLQRVAHVALDVLGNVLAQQVFDVPARAGRRGKTTRGVRASIRQARDAARRRRARSASTYLGGYLPRMRKRSEPSMEPVVPSSARKKAI